MLQDHVPWVETWRVPRIAVADLHGQGSAEKGGSVFPQLLEVVRVNCLQRGTLFSVCVNTAQRTKPPSCSQSPSLSMRPLCHRQPAAAEPNSNSGTDPRVRRTGWCRVSGRGRGTAQHTLGWPDCRMGQPGRWVKGNTNHCLWSELPWGVWVPGSLSFLCWRTSQVLITVDQFYREGD